MSESYDTTTLRFEGPQEDEETSLHYNGYRYYDPMTGRYISPDPAGGPPPIESPRGVFRSSGHGNGQTATSSWDHPMEIPLNSGARPAGGYNREQGLQHGCANWRPPRPDATPAP